jgi:hypothetical protein
VFFGIPEEAHLKKAIISLGYFVLQITDGTLSFNFFSIPVLNHEVKWENFVALCNVWNVWTKYKTPGTVGKETLSYILDTLYAS